MMSTFHLLAEARLSANMGISNTGAILQTFHCQGQVKIVLSAAGKAEEPAQKLTPMTKQK